MAKGQLERLAGALERDHPGAAAFLREGFDETLTSQRLVIKGVLYRTLRSTNPIDNLNGSVAQFTRNVRRWRDGTMVVRRVGAALHEARKHLRRLRGYRAMPRLVAALRRHERVVKTAQRKVDTRRKAD